MYKTVKVFKDPELPKKIVETGLSLEEARKKVNDDKVTNSRAKNYMLIYTREVPVEKPKRKRIWRKSS